MSDASYMPRRLDTKMYTFVLSVHAPSSGYFMLAASELSHSETVRTTIHISSAHVSLG